jgi:hypothetical protein
VLQRGIKSFGGSPAGTIPVRQSLWGWVREANSGDWQKGLTIDPLGGIAAFGAVFSCVRRIATDIAKLEPHVLMTDENGISVPAPSASPYWNVLLKPNGFTATATRSSSATTAAWSRRCICSTRGT